jgi:hypothetical protein
LNQKPFTELPGQGRKKIFAAIFFWNRFRDETFKPGTLAVFLHFPSPAAFY